MRSGAPRQFKTTPPRENIKGADGKRVVIKPHVTERRYLLLTAEGLQLAEHESPKWLSDSALGSGALEVRWAFDLAGVE